jgi:hypothetical protein
MAQAMGIEKGEEFEWEIENKNLLVLSRVKPKANRKFKKCKN